MGAGDVAAYSAALQAFLSAELSGHRVRRYGTQGRWSLSTADPAKLAGWWAEQFDELLPGEFVVAPGPMDRLSLEGADPAPGKNRVHLDFTLDLDAEVLPGRRRIGEVGRHQVGELSLGGAG